MRALNHRVRRGRRGFTIIEMSITLTVLAMVVGSVASIVLSGRKAYEQGMSVSAVEMQARRALERIASEITPAVRTTMTPTATAPLGTSTLSFRTCEGAIGGVVQTSALMRIELRQDPRDANDGLDNDGDGLIDEGEIALVRDAGGANEVDAVIVRNVSEYLEGETVNLADDNGNGLTDERGLSLVVDANGTLTIRLTLEAVDPNNQLVRRTVETSVSMRN